MCKSLPFIAIAVLLFSCNKEPLAEAAPSLIGNWKHYTDNNSWHIIRINENGEGTMQWFTNGKLNQDTKTRTWYVKDNTLHFGKTPFNGELYKITEYPQNSGIEVIEGYDTIKANSRFIYLDSKLYPEF